MQQKNTSRVVSEKTGEKSDDTTSLTANIADSSFGMNALVEAQRRNFQAMVEVNQKAIQGWQSLARRQSEMMTKFFQDNAGFARSMTVGAEGNSPASMSALLETVMQNGRELATIACTCTTEAAEILTRRVSDGIGGTPSKSDKR